MATAQEQVERWSRYAQLCEDVGDREEARVGAHRVWLFSHMEEILAAGQPVELPVSSNPEGH